MPELGTIGWVDLTVPDAEGVRDFYRDVVGWTSTDVAMGTYNDFAMVPPGAENAIAGVCHARGGNASLPAQWLIYVYVENLDRSIEACKARGGEVVAGPKSAGESGRYCVVRDPAGAHLALFEAKA